MDNVQLGRPCLCSHQSHYSNLCQSCSFPDATVHLNHLIPDMPTPSQSCHPGHAHASPSCQAQCAAKLCRNALRGNSGSCSKLQMAEQLLSKHVPTNCVTVVLSHQDCHQQLMRYQWMHPHHQSVHIPQAGIKPIPVTPVTRCSTLPIACVSCLWNLPIHLPMNLPKMKTYTCRSTTGSMQIAAAQHQ